VISLWFTPGDGGLEASVAPTGAVPVEPEGGWSRLVAGLGGLFGASIQERAAPMVEEQGSAQLRERLARGFTFTFDLCRGQADGLVGALGNGEVPERPYPPDGLRWLANQRVRLRPGGLDVAGPFQPQGAPLHVDLEVERGEGIEAELVCAERVPRVAEQLGVERPVGQRGERRAGPRPAAAARVLREAPAFLEADASACPLALVVRPLGPEPVVYRMRAYGVGERAEPLVECAR